jgi:cytochrome c
MTGGDATRAPGIMRRYGCGGCHTIPGIPGADGQTGPQLSGLIHHVYIGGVATNSPDHLIQWLVAPQTISPHSAMPATGISEAEARDVAAYLYAQ